MEVLRGPGVRVPERLIEPASRLLCDSSTNVDEKLSPARVMCTIAAKGAAGRGRERAVRAVARRA